MPKLIFDSDASAKKDTHLHILIPAGLHESLKKIARRENQTIGAVVRQMIKLGITEYDKSLRQ